MRLVKVYHVATPPQEHPENSDLKSVSGSEAWWSARVVSMRTDENEPQDIDMHWDRDELYQWYSDGSANLDVDMDDVDWCHVKMQPKENVDRYHINMVKLQVMSLSFWTLALTFLFCLSACGKRAKQRSLGERLFWKMHKVSS